MTEQQPQGESALTPHFAKCCCCIDLKTGATIIGILNFLAVIFGVIELIIWFANTYFIALLGVATLGMLNILPAIAFVKQYKDPTKENKEQFARWYLFAEAIGLAAYVAFYFIDGFFISGIIGGVVEACILYYFYLCLLSYSRVQDVVVYQQPMAAPYQSM